MKPSLRGYSLEEIAENFLVSRGYEILERRKTVVKNNTPIAEIDIVAKKDNELYAIEVKSGRISITDIRQTYTNAVLVNAKPLIIGRGFSDKASEETAKILNVEVLILDEYLSFISLEELSASVDQSFINILSNIFSFDITRVNSKDLEVIKVLAMSKNFSDATEKLNMSKRELSNIIKDFRNRRVLTYTRTFNTIRLQANIIYNMLNLYRLLKNNLG
ncbi:MAG: YraN family protein [Thermoproteales archaeon]|nr:YraN family protein [Thermoproteales archaeon]